METKSLKEWMKKFGYQWVDGKEQFMKGELSYGDAAETIGQLLREGAVCRG